MSRVVAKRRKLGEVKWDTLYDNLIRHTVTFLDYKEAFAVKRLSKAWHRSLDDARQRQFLSRRTALNLSYTLFDQIGGARISHLQLPPHDHGKNVWANHNGNSVGERTIATDMYWSATSCSDEYWTQLLQKHETRATNFDFSAVPRVIDVDLGPREKCFLHVHPIIVSKSLQLSDRQWDQLEQLVTRTRQRWKTAHDKQLQWRPSGKGAMWLFPIVYVSDERQWEKAQQQPSLMDLLNVVIQACPSGRFRDASSWHVPTESFPLRAAGANEAAALQPA
jgi:hypothetical protein